MKKFTLITAILLCTVWIFYGQWTYTNLSEPKNAMAYAVLGSKIINAGGYGNSGALSAVEVFDAVSGQFIPMGNLSMARGNATGVVCGSKFFCAGGGVAFSQPTKTVDIYDNETQQWTDDQLTEGRFLLSSVSYGNKVIFAGGFINWTLNSSNIVDIYNLENNSWTKDSLSIPRGVMASAVVGNLALFAGGMIDPEHFSDRVDIFNFTDNTWSTATLSQPRAFIEATTVGNKVLIAGGISAMGVPSIVVDIYNASNGTWEVDSLSSPRALVRAATLKGKAYFAGGATFDYGWSNFSNVIDIYDEASDTWSVESMLVPHQANSIASVGNYLIIAGGENEGGLTDLVEVFYNPQTGINSKESNEGTLNIFPNPSKDKITISSPSITGNTHLSIFNVSGEKVMEIQLSDNETQIDISALPRGVYFVRVQDEKRVEVERIIKQ